MVELWLQAVPRWRCTCPDAASRGADAVAQPASTVALCKHAVALVLWAAKDSPAPPLPSNSLPPGGTSEAVRPFVPAGTQKRNLEKMSFREQVQHDMIRHGPRHSRSGERCLQ